MRWLPLVATLLALATRATAELKQYEFIIRPITLDPDCNGTSYTALTVNGLFPGPTIRAQENDELEILVHNLADEPTTVHFHGIRQHGTVQADGVPDITQNAIPPGGSFTHKFKLIAQTGTYFYHAHVGTQDDTVQGALIIDPSSEQEKKGKRKKKKEEEEEDSDDDDDDDDDDEVVMIAQYYEDQPAYLDTPPYSFHDGPYDYHGEFTLHLTEWWHSSYQDREKYILSPNFTHDSDADSVLINGRTTYDATMPLTPHCSGHTTFDVLPNRVYRMRVIGGMTFRTFGLGIAGHDMTIIEVDGALIQPYRTSSLEVGPGQRYSVLIETTASQEQSEFIIATNYLYRLHEEGVYSNGVAYLKYLDPSKLLNKRDQTPEAKPTTSENKYAEYPDLPKHIPANWIWPFLRPLHPPPSAIVDGPPDRTLKIRPVSSTLPDGSQRYKINGNLSPMVVNMEDTEMAMQVGSDGSMMHQYTLAQTQTLLPDRLPLEPDGFEPLLGTYPVRYHEIIDVVLQNVKVGPLCIHHPWHTHGHSHYLIASGDGEYIPDRDHLIRNFPHPIYKDVSAVYATTVDPITNGCGWTKIRIFADNPGVWAVHCHITAHMMQGMLFILEEASDRIQEHQLYT